MTEKFFTTGPRWTLRRTAAQRAFTLPAGLADLTPTYFVKAHARRRVRQIDERKFLLAFDEARHTRRTEDRVRLVLHADETVRGFHGR